MTTCQTRVEGLAHPQQCGPGCRERGRSSMSTTGVGLLPLDADRLPGRAAAEDVSLATDHVGCTRRTGRRGRNPADVRAWPASREDRPGGRAEKDLAGRATIRQPVLVNRRPGCDVLPRPRRGTPTATPPFQFTMNGAVRSCGSFRAGELRRLARPPAAALDTSCASGACR